jgi:hypothetical protein
MAALTLTDIAECARAAAAGKALLAANVLLRRASAVAPDASASYVLERLVHFATGISENDVAEFERVNRAFRVQLPAASDTTLWLAPDDFPPLVPRAPSFSLRGLRALGAALVEALVASDEPQRRRA